VLPGPRFICARRPAETCRVMRAGSILTYPRQILLRMPVTADPGRAGRGGNQFPGRVPGPRARLVRRRRDHHREGPERHSTAPATGPGTGPPASNWASPTSGPAPTGPRPTARSSATTAPSLTNGPTPARNLNSSSTSSSPSASRRFCASGQSSPGAMEWCLRWLPFLLWVICVDQQLTVIREAPQIGAIDRMVTALQLPSSLGHSITISASPDNPEIGEGLIGDRITAPPVPIRALTGGAHAGPRTARMRRLCLGRDQQQAVAAVVLVEGVQQAESAALSSTSASPLTT
jgi:hypothetical protein